MPSVSVRVIDDLRREMSALLAVYETGLRENLAFKGATADPDTG